MYTGLYASLGVYTGYMPPYMGETVVYASLYGRNSGICLPSVVYPGLYASLVWYTLGYMPP